MQCPYCGSDSQVLDSRMTSESVRRRRACAQCRRRFTTYERLSPPNIKVIKRSGASEPFDGAKLARVLCRVAGSGVLDDNAALRIARAIEAELIDERVKSLHSWQVLERLLQAIAGIDPLAYKRLAADYTDESGQLRLRSSEDEAGSADQLRLFGDEDLK